MSRILDEDENMIPLLLNGGEAGSKETAGKADVTKEPSACRSFCWNWGGLTSPNVKTRRYARLIWGSIFVVTAVLIILAFTVIIPAIIQSLVDKSDLTLESTEISDIQEDSFTSTTVAQFSNVHGPSGVKIQLKSINIEWDHGNYGTMVQLAHSNTLDVKNGVDTTMLAEAKVTNKPAFADFNSYLMHQSEGVWTLSGKADVNCFVKATVDINQKQLVFQGFNNFTVPPKVLETNITEGTKDVLYSQARVTMTSSSNVKLALHRPLYFHFEFDGQVLGIGHIPDYVMEPGTVELMSYIAFTHTNDQQRDALMKLLSHYSIGIDANVTMKRFFLEPAISWLTPALASISMDTTLPSTKQPMVKEITIYNKIIPTSLPFTLTMFNPQSIAVTVTSIVGALYIGDTKIADVTVPSISPPIVIPPYSTVTSQQLPSKSYVNSASIKLLKDGHGLGFSENTIGANFGEFPASFYYKQADVPLTIIPIFQEEQQ